MVKINLQVITLLLATFIIVLYIVDLYIPLAAVTAFKAGAYFFLASTIVAQAFAAIFGQDDKNKKNIKKKRGN